MKWDKSNYEKHQNHVADAEDADAANAYYEIQRFLLLDFPGLSIGTTFEIDAVGKINPVIYNGTYAIASGRNLIEAVREANRILKCPHEFGLDGWCTVCGGIHKTRLEGLK